MRRIVIRGDVCFCFVIMKHREDSLNKCLVFRERAKKGGPGKNGNMPMLHA